SIGVVWPPMGLPAYPVGLSAGGGVPTIGGTSAGWGGRSWAKAKIGPSARNTTAPMNAARSSIGPHSDVARQRKTWRRETCEIVAWTPRNCQSFNAKLDKTAQRGRTEGATFSLP